MTQKEYRKGVQNVADSFEAIENHQFRGCTMIDGTKYYLSDFSVEDCEFSDGMILKGLKHISGFWFSLNAFIDCFDSKEDARKALTEGVTITRYHKNIYGKSIKHYVVEF